MKKFNYQILEKMADKILNYSNREWKKIINKHVIKYIYYNANNTLFYSKIKKMGIEKKFIK